ncbi:hypothetical protein [Methylobacterium oryzihabitans]|uniref:Large exoprotein involved in heme utilization or adhesion n=1 Tax=Methylobacterium oryzihabitans TaxID=2499852 RepID=A0A437P7F1_9HYPH|nr:hypothetical protein [Methylobacterium oryzihabitans]RVU18139.1 hypothetical protein EOE48_12185 [Methylobacterium oryzihabitans]
MKTALIAALGAGVLSFHAPARAEMQGFDGTWNVRLVTESGLCDSSYSYALSIRDGDVRLAASDGGATITGRIGRDGSVGLNVRNGAAQGAASGRLQANSGSGTWTVSSLCTGRWVAQRRSARVAQAD